MIKDKYNFIPMGVLSVSGYINNDVNMDFDIQYILEDDGIGKVTSVSQANDFPPPKEECANDFCE